MSWFSLNPISAIANIIRIARESERRERRETIIGSAPYHPPEDSGIAWQPTPDGYGRQYVNRKASRPPFVTVPQWCGRCRRYTDHATGRCERCGR